MAGRTSGTSLPARGRGPASLLAVVALVVAACGSSTPTSSPLASPTANPIASATMSATPWASGSGSASPAPSSSPSASETSSATPEPTGSPSATAPASFPLAVVVRYDDPRRTIAAAALGKAVSSGGVLVPCEVSALALAGASISVPDTATCVAAAEITAKVRADRSAIGLLPAGLVTPSVKVLRIGEADLFGSPSRRGLPYPLAAQGSFDGAASRYDANDVRTLISTGDTCPDRGVSYQANVLKKGWPWVLNGGSAHYTGFFEHPWGWPVPYIARNGDAGKVAALVSDNDVSANDFECPMLRNYRQAADGSTNFSIDPRVAPLLAKTYGIKAVTLGSNHITDQGAQGVRETLQILDAAGIAHTGAGNNIAQALAPAIVDAHGVKFAFVGWDDIEGSGAAGPNTPGAAPLTDSAVCSSLQAARKQADVVIAMPQWGWPEYHNDITKEQRQQRQHFYDCGADHVLGSGTHWASWASILPGDNGPHFAIGSHGNFLFGQNWSRQTMEGVVVEATFVGTKLVQFRLHPYVVVDQAQPNLLEPTTDGKYVLNQVWSVSEVR